MEEPLEAKAPGKVVFQTLLHQELRIMHTWKTEVNLNMMTMIMMVPIPDESKFNIFSYT